MNHIKILYSFNKSIKAHSKAMKLVNWLALGHVGAIGIKNRVHESLCGTRNNSSIVLGSRDQVLDFVQITNNMVLRANSGSIVVKIWTSVDDFHLRRAFGCIDDIFVTGKSKLKHVAKEISRLGGHSVANGWDAIGNII